MWEKNQVQTGATRQCTNGQRCKPRMTGGAFDFLGTLDQSELRTVWRPTSRKVREVGHPGKLMSRKRPESVRADVVHPPLIFQMPPVPIPVEQPPEGIFISNSVVLAAKGRVCPLSASSNMHSLLGCNQLPPTV